MLTGNFIRESRADCQTAHFLRHIMMIWVRFGAVSNAAVTELGRTSTTLTGMTSSFLPVWFFITARYFSTSLGGSIALTAVDQLGCDHLVENRDVGGDSEHLLAQFELFKGLTGLIIDCSRGHFGLPH